LIKLSKPDVLLVDIDEDVLDRLIAAAVNEASANEVTPPITSDDLWSETRIDWLRELHRDRRTGLSGPSGEATWAVMVGDSVVGSIRLKHTDESGVLETGVWLTRRARGHGIGTASVDLVLGRATTFGAHTVRATTTAGNSAALAVLRRLGFVLSEGVDETAVEARCQLDRHA
jgi:RimJ/RimL family protein N-acetyltransferase